MSINTFLKTTKLPDKLFLSKKKKEKEKEKGKKNPSIPERN